MTNTTTEESNFQIEQTTGLRPGVLVVNGQNEDRLLLVHSRPRGWECLVISDQTNAVLRRIEDVDFTVSTSVVWSNPQPSATQVASWLGEFYRLELASVHTDLNEAQDMRNQWHSRADRAEAALVEFKERATRVAHSYADDADLCERFDQAMVEIGLPARRRRFSVPVLVEMTVHVEVEASSPAEAEEMAVDEGTLDPVVREYTMHNSYSHEVDEGWND